MSTLLGRGIRVIALRHTAATDDTTNWRALSRCRDEDPELFFPIGKGVLAERQTYAAKQVCARCPVIDDCRREAFEEPIAEYGVFGGLDEYERRALRPKRDTEVVCVVCEDDLPAPPQHAGPVLLLREDRPRRHPHPTRHVPHRTRRTATRRERRRRLRHRLRRPGRHVQVSRRPCPQTSGAARRGEADRPVMGVGRKNRRDRPVSGRPTTCPVSGCVLSAHHGGVCRDRRGRAVYPGV